MNMIGVVTMLMTRSNGNNRSNLPARSVLEVRRPHHHTCDVNDSLPPLPLGNARKKNEQSDFRAGSDVDDEEEKDDCNNDVAATGWEKGKLTAAMASTTTAAALAQAKTKVRRQTKLSSLSVLY